MRKVLAVTAVVYLLGGGMFASQTMPEQLWACPDAAAPHGETLYGGLDEPPRPDCRPTVTTGERAEWFAFATVAWAPLVVAKGFANMSEPA